MDQGQLRCRHFTHSCSELNLVWGRLAGQHVTMVIYASFSFCVNLIYLLNLALGAVCHFSTSQCESSLFKLYAAWKDLLYERKRRWIMHSHFKHSIDIKTWFVFLFRATRKIGSQIDNWYSVQTCWPYEPSITHWLSHFWPSLFLMWLNFMFSSYVHEVEWMTYLLKSFKTSISFLLAFHFKGNKYIYR